MDVEKLTLGNPFAIFEPWIWRRLATWAAPTCSLTFDFVDWNVEKGQQGKLVLSTMLSEETYGVLQLKLSGIDIEKDKNSKFFMISTVFVQFFSNYR